MSTHNKYFARLGPVREPRYRIYRIGQRTVVNGSADAHRKPHAQFIKGTLPGYRYSVSLLAVMGKPMIAEHRSLSVALKSKNRNRRL